jgi:hypothetical protein
MFDETPELSPDLEWMLQSGQVDDASLVAALIDEHYANLYRLGLVLLGSAELATVFAQQTLALAIVDAHRYRAETPLLVWLLSLALPVWRRLRQRQLAVRGDPSPSKVERSFGDARVIEGGGRFGDWRAAWAFTNGVEIYDLPGEPHLPQLLNRIYALSPGDIACITRFNLEFVDDQLAEVDATGVMGKKSVQPWDTLLAQAFTLTHFSSQEIAHINSAVEGWINRARRTRTALARLQEVALVGLAVLLVLLFGRVYAALAPEPEIPMPIQQTVIVTQVVSEPAAPLPQSSPTPLPERAMLYKAHGGETLESLAAKIGTDVIILQVLNDHPPGEPLAPDQHVVIGIGVSPVTAPRQSLNVLRPLRPLPTDVDAAEIRRRLLESSHFWSNLWADVQVISNPPGGYAGQGRLERTQIWISQPTYSALALNGDISGELAEILIKNRGRVDYHNLVTGEANISTNRSAAWPSFGLQLVDRLLLPDGHVFNARGEVEVLGVEPVAGRSALVVDWFRTGYPEAAGEAGAGLRAGHLGRYWLDRLTGVVLRSQIFDPLDPQRLVREVLVQEIVFDVDLPEQLFDPFGELPTSFAIDPGGSPLSVTGLDGRSSPVPVTSTGLLPRQQPPPDFDPGRSSLTFQWAWDEPPSAGGLSQMEVFAGDDFLGTVEFGDPWRTTCTRSPDGRLLAYTFWRAGHGNAPLRWFSLDDLENVHLPLPSLSPQDFAFSPDGRQLALIACRREEDCRLYLIDTDTGHRHRIRNFAEGNFLAWDPSGEFLAFQGRAYTGAPFLVMVISAKTGDIVYTGPRDLISGRAAEGSPTRNWDGDFPPLRIGLQECVAPP